MGLEKGQKKSRWKCLKKHILSPLLYEDRVDYLLHTLDIVKSHLLDFNLSSVPIGSPHARLDIIGGIDSTLAVSRTYPLMAPGQLSPASLALTIEGCPADLLCNSRPPLADNFAFSHISLSQYNPRFAQPYG